MTIKTKAKPAAAPATPVHDAEGKAKLIEGGKALKRIKASYTKLWEDWTGEGSVGQAVVVASDEALRISGAKERKGKAYASVFSALLKEYGLSEDDGLDGVTRAALLNLMPRLDLVNNWLAERAEPDRLNHPRVVWATWSKPLKEADRKPKPKGQDDGQRHDDLPDDDIFGAAGDDDEDEDAASDDDIDTTGQEGDNEDAASEGDDDNVVTLKPRARTGDESKATIESLRGENERLKSKLTLRDNRIVELEKENRTLKARIRELENAVLPKTPTGEPVSGVLDMADYQQFKEEQTV